MYNQKQTLWETPLRKAARTRKQTPEAWHAECLSGEREVLQVAVRSLEFANGFYAGRSVGRVENVLATKLAEETPGRSADAAS